jgi:hypothetical protein
MLKSKNELLFELHIRGRPVWQQLKVVVISVNNMKVTRTSEVGMTPGLLDPLTPELNPSAQRCLMRFFTGDFAT